MPTAFYSIPRTKRRKKQRNKERNKDRIWIGNFLEDHIQLDIHGKSLALHIINWMQIKPMKSYDITHVQMSSLGKMGDSKCWREWRMTASLHTLWREACAAIGESSMGASQEKNALLHGWVLSEKPSSLSPYFHWRLSSSVPHCGQPQIPNLHRSIKYWGPYRNMLCHFQERTDRKWQFHLETFFSLELLQEEPRSSHKLLRWANCRVWRVSLWQLLGYPCFRGAYVFWNLFIPHPH